MQTHPLTLSRALIVLFAAAILLSGCGPVRPDSEDLANQANTARQLESAGDYAAAAKQWRAIAASAAGTERDSAMLSAASNAYRAGQVKQARADLASIPVPAAPDRASEYLLLRAELAIADNDARDALEALELLPAEASTATRIQALELQADAYLLVGQAGPAVVALEQRGSLLESPAAVEENQRQIWNRLQEAAAADANFAVPSDANPVARGWLQLGALLEAYGRNPFQLQASLMDWRARNPGHPASGKVLGAALATYRDLNEYPRRVALLLPLSGRLAASAIAVRDGFIAAYYQQPEQRPAVSIYDTDRLGAVGAWEQAAAEGADFIVGPLSKNELEALATVSGGVPTLALNEVPRGEALPEFIYQFGLSPEDEAAQAAARALGDGLSQAIALVPNNDWGMRIAASFGETLQAGGGRLLGIASYAPGTADLSDPIRGLLLVDASARRHQRLESLLGLNLEFEPRRRQDADLVFVAAQPADGRQIRPQLKFQYGADLPVYATSAIYAPDDGPHRDLDGVRFDDMPWIISSEAEVVALRERLAKIWPGSSGRRARLYALGFDAFRLVPILRNDRSLLDQGVPGLTGVLRLAPEQRIVRGLDWAAVVNGQLRILGPLNDMQ
ncbi:MAG: penicillin-binding protein activator [Gammaproteobacteria bacterium]